MSASTEIELRAIDRAGTPEWWANRLYVKLTERQVMVAFFDAYYRGDHPLPWLPRQIADIARRILRMSRTNVMGLVCDATVERLEPIGFQVGDQPGADEEAWRIWQANNLDALIGEAFLEATKCGCSYLMVAPNKDDRATPIVTVEHPAQVYVEYEPGNMRKRRAGIKVWFDDIAGKEMATLFLDGWIYKWQGAKGSRPGTWERRIVPGEEWPARNPLEVVPLVELLNNPQTTYYNGNLIRCGVSELYDVTDIQDRINKTVADRLVSQDFGAFPQKWATGWAGDDEDDEASPSGDPGAATSNGYGYVRHPAARVNLGRDRLVVAEDKDVKFGEWTAADLGPYTGAKADDVKDIAARTRTPSQYLLGELVNISADALHAAESGLVSKVRQRMRPYGEALEEAVRLFLLAAGDKRATEAGRSGTVTLWRDPEYRSLAAVTDAVMKQYQRDATGGPGLLSWQASMEKLGYGPQQIKEIAKQRRQEQVASQAMEMVRAAHAAQLAQPKPAPEQLTQVPRGGGQQPQPVKPAPGAQPSTE